MDKAIVRTMLEAVVLVDYVKLQLHFDIYVYSFENLLEGGAVLYGRWMYMVQLFN